MVCISNQTNTTPTNNQYVGLLIKMQNNATSQYTIRNTDKALKFLSHNCNIQDPETVKAFIASH